MYWMGVAAVTEVFLLYVTGRVGGWAIAGVRYEVLPEGSWIWGTGEILRWCECRQWDGGEGDVWGGCCGLARWCCGAVRLGFVVYSFG